MFKSLLIPIFLLMSVSLLAQHPTCNGTRYVTEEFTAVDTILGVQFGNNTTVGGSNQDLFMDIYVPVGDTAAMRPLIILAFGGSFIGGSRQTMASVCQYYALRGFVAATIDYRVYDGPIFPFPDSSDMTDVVIKAVSDMKASIRYFKEDAATSNNYKIDPNLIFVGGESAGGILASHVAYVDSTDNLAPNELTAIQNNGGFEGNSSTNHNLYNSEVHGVVNFSGALRYASMIDASDPPLFSAHDDGDNVVPYGSGTATFFGFIPIITLQGSSIMHQHCDTLGIYNELITIPNSNSHVSYFNGNAATWEDSVLIASTLFLHNLICPANVAVQQVEQKRLSAKFYPNPAAMDMTVEIEDLLSSYHIAVYDNMGRLVFEQQNINEGQFTLSKQYFSTGIYFVKIQFEDPTIAPILSKVVFR